MAFVELNNIVCGDCLTVMDNIEKSSIDLVVTSPPYNVDNYNRGGYDIYNDNLDHSKYITFLEDVFKKTYKLLKIGGRVVINIGDGKNGGIPTSSDIIQFMVHKLNYLPMTHIIWDKSQTINRCAWGSWKSPSSPSFPTPFEHILVFSKMDKKLQYKGKTDLTRDEFINWSLALWKFAPEKQQKKIGHPAMFPEELSRRCIKLFSYINATVLDPFVGAGTTAVSAKNLKRNFIGIDISEKYCAITNKRLGIIGGIKT